MSTDRSLSEFSYFAIAVVLGLNFLPSSRANFHFSRNFALESTKRPTYCLRENSFVVMAFQIR